MLPLAAALAFALAWWWQLSRAGTVALAMLLPLALSAIYTPPATALLRGGPQSQLPAAPSSAPAAVVVLRPYHLAGSAPPRRQPASEPADRRTLAAAPRRPRLLPPGPSRSTPGRRAPAHPPRPQPPGPARIGGNAAIGCRGGCEAQGLPMTAVMGYTRTMLSGWPLRALVWIVSLLKSEPELAKAILRGPASAAASISRAGSKPWFAS